MEKKHHSGYYYRIVFRVCLVASIVLLVAGFLLPPMGVIDNSVLKAVGLLLGFASVDKIGEAVKDGRTARFEKGDMSVTFGNKEDMS